MFLAYVDESGDRGIGGSRTYALGCVLVEDTAWPETFDQLIAFRRFLRASFGLPVRAELKANHLLRNAGAFRPLALSEPSRHAIYRQSMRLHAKLDLQTFAVVIDKARLAGSQPARDPADVAWDYLLQRLERFTTRGNTHLLLLHDEGDSAHVRKLARKARRAGTAGSMFGTGQLRRPFKRLVEDTVPRNSAQSYFLQLADLAAYAAYRRLHPPPPRPVHIVPQGMWNELGAARLAVVNKYSGGPPAIVQGP